MSEEIRAEWQDWQERTLGALLWGGVAVTGAVAVFLLFVRSTAPHSLVFMGLSAVLLAAATSRRASYACRAVALFGAFQVGGLYGFLMLGGAANLSAMCAAVVFATLLMGRSWGLANAAFATATTLVTGLLFRVHLLGPVIPFDPDGGLPLVRAALSFGAIATSMALALGYFLHRARTLLVEKVGMAEALAKARELEILGRLTSCVAHDFNNALLVIQASADLARRDARHTETALREIDQAVFQARATARELRTTFCPRAARPAVELSMGESVRHVCELLRRILPKSIAVDVVTDDAALVRADEGLIQNVVTNLVLNARDAMPEGGTLAVRVRVADGDDEEATGARVEGRFVAVEVRDDGVGMDRETMARVFEPFFTTKGCAGTGLGLASVKSLVESAGGLIHLESAPEAGTAVAFYWPLVDVEAPEVDARSSWKVRAARPAARGSSAVEAESA